MENLIDRVREIKSLPALPEVITELNNLLCNNLGGALELSELISKDVALAAMVLKAVNSPLYNFSGKKITDIRAAVIRIGRSDIYSMFLTISMINTIPSCNGNINYRAYWLHSLTVANMAKNICSYSSHHLLDEEVREIYFAALMHDIGIMLYALYFPERLDDIKREMENKGIDFRDSEMRISQNDNHSRLGAYLMELWGSSLAIHTMVKYHETPKRSPIRFQSHTSIISIADRIVSGISDQFPQSSYRPITENIWQIAGVESSLEAELVHISEDEFSKSGSILSSWSLNSSRNMGAIKPTSSTSILKTI